MEVVVTAVDQVALEGTTGITLTKLWYEVGRTLNRQLSYCQKLRIISHLLHTPGYRCFYLDHPRKLSILPPVSDPLKLYGAAERHYAPNASVQFSCKNPIPPLYINPAVADFGFCPDRLNRVEMDDTDAEDLLEYDPDRLTVVANYSDRVRMLLPPDVAVEEQVETFSMFMILEYLAKCRERGAFLSELREDWASGLDVYALVSQAYKNGLICKENWCIKNKSDNVVLVKLSRFADRTNFNEDIEEKLPAPVIAFDQAMIDYRKNFPDKTSFPRKFLMPYFNNDMNDLKKNVEYMKAHGYIKCVYIRSGKTLNKFGEEKFVPQLQRCHPKPKFKWSNPISDKSAPVVAPDLIEPDQTMGSMYRDLLSQSDVTLNNISAYTGCMYYVARGVDKHFSQAYKDQINVSTVEYCKTFTKVRSVAIDDNSNEPSSSLISVVSDNRESKQQHPQSEFETVPETVTAPDSSMKKQPSSQKSSSSGKKVGAALWKDYITHDLTEFGIELTPEDFTFKHKFFRTDLQKLRRAVVLKHLAKLSVMEINSLAGVVGEVEKTIGLTNPMWDRKSRKRFMDILSAENLISQIGVKYDRNGLEREVHVIVLPGVDENHPLVHKLITDKATVRFTDKDKEQLAQDADLQRLADSTDDQQQNNDLDRSNVPFVSMLNGDETASNVVVSLTSLPVDSASIPATELELTEQVHSVLDLESEATNEITDRINSFNHDYAVNGATVVTDAGNSQSLESGQAAENFDSPLISQPPQLPAKQATLNGAETICAPVWGSLGYSHTHDSPDIYFGQYVPTMHCARLLHSIILYKVWGVELTLPPKYIESLDSFMLSPSVYGEGWLSYSDVMDMLPVKVLGMFLERTALNLHFKCLGNLLYTSHEPIGLIHPTFRSCLVTNEAVVNRTWVLVKLLCNLGCLSLLRKIEGERRKPAFIYVRTHTLFYDTRQVPASLPMPLERRLDATDFPCLEFYLQDSKSFCNYWDTLREVCVDTCMNELFANGRLFRSKFFARKGTVYSNCSINLSRFYVQKVSPDIAHCQPPICYEFGAAGTEERMFLQDPCHWLFLKQANAAVKQIIKHLQEKGALNALQQEEGAVDAGTGNPAGSSDGSKAKLLSNRRKPVTPFSKIINEKVQQLKRKRDRQKEREKRRQQKEAEIKAMVKDSTLTTGDISSSRSSGANNQHKAANNFASRASRIAVRKREDELMRSQRKINWDINQSKSLLRVYWTPDEDAVLLYAYTSMHVFRIYHGYHVLPYGFFMRDVLHELLPQLASNKNEMACSRRFRYLMNNDYRSMLLFFGLKAHANKTATVLDVLELSVPNLSIDELYRRYKKLYNAVVRCNSDFVSVDVRWNMRFMRKNFNMENFLPMPMVENYWNNSSLCEKGEQWKESLFSSIQTLMLNFFFEKNINPYVASTIVLAKLLSVPSIAEIVGPVSSKLEKNVLVSNSKMFKEFPIYRKFISNLVSSKNLKQINKLLLLTISRQPTSKSLVTIYEDKTFSVEPLKDLLVHKRVVKCGDEERYCTFFYMVCLMDSIPLFNYRIQMKYPLFEFPLINLTSEEKRVLELRRERKAKKSRGGGVEAEEEEEEDEEWTESDEEELEEEGDSRIMQAVPKTHLPGQPLHKGKIEAGEPEDIEVVDDEDLKDLLKLRFKSERVEIEFNEEDLRQKQMIGLGKAEQYRSYLAVTSQEKDQKIITNTPDISFAPREDTTQDQIEAKLNHYFFEQDNYQQIDIKSVFDLVLVKSPSDCELLPKMPVYVTSYAASEQFNDCVNFTESESIILACIQNAAHDGLTFDSILQDYMGLTERNLLEILESLILKNAILVIGDREIKFCAKDYCPFFTSLRSQDAVTAHKIPTDSSFNSIKFLPAAFLNWDGSFCTNMFATMLSWLAECSTYIPGASFMDFHDRVCLLINPVQFLKLVKFAEKLDLIRVEIHKEDLAFDNFFMGDNNNETSKSKDVSDVRNLYLFPVCDAMLRTKLFCEKFNMNRHLFYIGPQRLSLYASMNLYSTRKLFDNCLTYCDSSGS